MNLIPEIWPHQAGPHRPVNQQPHQQQHGSDIAKHSLMVLSISSCPAYASQWIRPETCIYHYRALILPLEYLFPFAASPSILSSQERMWNRFPFRRERKTGFFSQGVELEDGTFANQRWVLRPDRGHERQSCSECGESAGNYTSYCHWFWGKSLIRDCSSHMMISLIVHLTEDLWKLSPALSGKISACYQHHWQVITDVGPCSDWH